MAKAKQRKTERKPNRDITTTILETLYRGGTYYSPRGPITLANLPRSYSEAISSGLNMYMDEEL